jgi:hypothetical protein
MFNQNNPDFYGCRVPHFACLFYVISGARRTAHDPGFSH